MFLIKTGDIYKVNSDWDVDVTEPYLCVIPEEQNPKVANI